MEGKKSNVSTIILIFAIIIIIAMGFVIYKLYTERTTETQRTEEFQSQLDNQNTSVNELKGENKTNSTNTNINETSKSNEVTTSNPSNSATNKSTVNISNVLQNYKEDLSNYTDSAHQYSVIDINNDGIPELLSFTSGVIGNEIIGEISIFTYDQDKNEHLFVGTIPGRIDTNTALYKMNDGRLLSVRGHMGYESTAYYKLENNWIVRTEFASRETNDYMTGDQEIIFKPCSDTSLIDNYKQ